MTLRSRSVLAAVLAALGTRAGAQTPAGPEFRVNTYTTESQQRPTVGMDGTSAFVVTWNSNGQDGSGMGVFGQRFTRAGVPQGAEFRVNEATIGNQSQWSSAAARAAAGPFLVVWHASDGSQDGIFARQHDAAGAPVGGDFRVNTFTTNFQNNAAASVQGAGTLVTWQSRDQDGSGLGIFAQRFDAAGARVGGEFQVNSTTAGNQYRPQAAADAAGNFVVVWDGDTDGSNWGIFGQRFDATGAPLGAEFRVNSYTTDRQTFPQVARAAAGSFVVAWSSYRQDGSGYGVFAQRFDAAGTPLGSEFRANSYTTSSQGQLSVAGDAAGSFVVAWRSYQDGSADGVFSQRYAPGGSPLGGEFRVNTYTTSNQNFPSVRSDAHGNLVFAWTSLGQDGAFFGIYGQRFGGLRPAALAVDTAGNGVLDPGEAAVIAPAWLNFNGAPLTFGGTALAFDGPAGPTYTVVDAAAAYGTVAEGASAGCQAQGDCYAVTAGGTRPALHWDARLLEQLQPGAQHGQTHAYTLHVGDSFSDVPRTSPFYRFVETLLHHGVTGGCGQGLYCPQSATTREQMAAFVLLAHEGAAYTPPACTTPVFPDVPADHPFCRWIEELFRRGVVAGCGGGNYCPGQPVTREQMAVFVLRTLDPALDPPACTTPLFADVPASSPFCRWIEELARRDVVAGCGGGNYCPTQPVTREQMGVFLGATFGLALYAP
jgi:hypothetical protein